MAADYNNKKHSIAIIGSGFGGLGMAIQLKKAGFSNFVILEKSTRVGGTWRDNTYPGAACDVQSHLYSYSFEPKHDWSRRFSPQAEIQAYIEHCVEKYQLAEHIRFAAEVTQATFNDSDQQWLVELSSGETLAVSSLITATGQLNQPAYPNISGLDTFTGTMFHSARWNHDYNLTGKRVAVVGTGASAIQFVPQIVPLVSELKLFQRSGAWVIPKPDKAFAPWKQWVFKHIPFVDRAYRGLIYLKNEARGLAFTRFSWVLTFIAWRAKRMAARDVTDLAKRKQLIPTYNIGCNRILMANDWYSSVDQAHVDLIADPITEVQGNTVHAEGGNSYEVDAIIFGTGFKATDFLAPIQITGRNGQSLNQAWQNGAEAYKGISVAGFPNLFMLYGPNTNLSHNSILYMLESQFSYILSCLKSLKQRGAACMDVIPERQTEFVDTLQSRLNKSVWASGCSSWYTTESGKNVANWYGFTFSFRRLTKRVNLADYNFTTLSSTGSRFTSGPSIFISGAAAGIGRATAELFLQQGWLVGAFDINEAALADFQASNSNGRLITGVLDVTDYDQWQLALNQFMHVTGGRLDVLFNNAGILCSGPFSAIPLAQQQKLININVNGLIAGCHAAFPFLENTPGARVINMSSASALYGQPSLATYSASKFAVRGITEALSIEWEQHDIKVMDLMPLFVRTRMVDNMNAQSIKTLGIRTQPEHVAKQVLALTTYNGTKVHWFIGTQTKLLALASKLTPAFLNRLSNKWIAGGRK